MTTETKNIMTGFAIGALVVLLISMMVNDGREKEYENQKESFENQQAIREAHTYSMVIINQASKLNAIMLSLNTMGACKCEAPLLKQLKDAAVLNVQLLEDHLRVFQNMETKLTQKGLWPAVLSNSEFTEAIDEVHKLQKEYLDPNKPKQPQNKTL